jgi:hypothetical protein
MKSASIAAVRTVSPSAQVNEWSLGFMVIWRGIGNLGFDCAFCQ